MGSCFSLDTNKDAAFTAKVISLNGALHEYYVPVKVFQVLQIESTHNHSSFFLCNSDNLYFDQHIPPMDSTEQLQMGQIYFVLPNIRLRKPLTAREMAALAVKATVALEVVSKKNRRKRQKRIQILPILDEDFDGMKRFNKTESSDFAEIQGSRPVKRVKRNATLRRTIGYRSFRPRLRTIHEGEVDE